MSIEKKIHQCGVIPVLAFSEMAHVQPAAQALVQGGLNVLEITLRTDIALDAIALIKERVPAAVVGVGTVTEPAHITQALKAGGDFLVSPGHTKPLLNEMQQCGALCLPGVATASEIMTVRDAGFGFQKLFPASSVGGAAFLKSIAGPIPGVRFCPTGGINIDTMGDYLQLSNVVCVGGSWVYSNALAEAGNWNEITSLAKKAVEAVSRITS